MKTPLFDLRRDTIRQPLEGSNKLELPQAECPDCGALYPGGPVHAVVKAEDAAAAGFKKGLNPDWAFFKEAETRLHQKSLLEGLLLPGAYLGPWTFKRKLREPWRDVDCLFGDPGSMLWKPAFTEAALNAGFRVRFEEVHVAPKANQKVVLHHIEVPTFDAAAEKSWGQDDRCATCGRLEDNDPFSNNEQIIWIRKMELKHLPPLFALLSYETFILARPDFAVFLQEQSPTGLILNEVGGVL